MSFGKSWMHCQPNRMKMKTTDLMCGDWVLINGTPHRIQAIDSVDEEISADDELYFVGEDRCHSEDKIEGIPITKEILQENDWGYVCETYFHKYGIKSFPEIRITAFIKNIGKLHLEIINNYLHIWFNYFLDYERMDADVIVPIKYIHDMQHALRLCGLNELADDFQVQKDFHRQ